MSGGPCHGIRNRRTRTGDTFLRSLVRSKIHYNNCYNYPSFSLGLCFLPRQFELPNSGVHLHIQAHGLVGDDHERLRLGANMLAHAILDVQQVCAGRKFDAIISFRISGYNRDRLFSLCAQDDQWILRIGLCRYRRHAPIGRFNGFKRKDFQVSLEHPGWLSGVVGRATEGNHEQDSGNRNALNQSLLPNKRRTGERLVSPSRPV